MSSKVMSLAAMLPAAMLASAEIVSVPLSTQEGVVGKSKAAGSYYSIDVAVGTPGQTVPVKFDTGSSELWVNPECDKSSNPAVCATLGRFTESTTLDVLEGETGTLGGAQVQYATDYVRIGSATITQQIVGLGQSSKDSVVGVFGAGPQASGFDSSYPTAIDSLAAQELIGSRAFSLDLKGQGSAKGSVIFGGVDTQKYAGHLTKLAVVPGPNGEAGWFVKLDSISISKAGGAATKIYSGPGQTVLLDSGSSLSTLPPAIFASLLEAFPSAKLDAATGLHSVDCSASTGSIDFSFADKVISVPVSDFVVNIPGSDLCVLGAFEGASAVLGDTFLKSVYAVFDFDNKAVHLAQAADCGSNLVAIGSGADAVPSVEGCGALARRLAMLREPEPQPTVEEEPDWCDEDDEDPEDDDDEWCDDDDDLPTGAPTNTRPTGLPTGGPGGHPTGGPGSQPTGGPGGHPTGGPGGHPTGGPGGHPTGGPGGPGSQPTGGHGDHGPTGGPAGPGSQPTGVPTLGPGGVHPTGPPTLGPGGVHPTGVPTLGPGGVHPTGGNGGHPGGPRPTRGPGGPHGPITRQTLTRTQYSTYTVTSCAPTVTNCPAGHVVTEIITRTTEVCPETTGVYTRHQGGKDHEFTITPVAPRPTAIPVPGCGVAPGGGSGSWTPGSGSSAPGSGSGSGSWAPGSGSGAPGSGAPGSGSGSWAPGSGSGAPGSGSGAPGSGSGSWAPGSGSAAPGSGSGSWSPESGAGAPGSGSGASGSGSGSWAPGSGSGAPGSGSGAPGSGAPSSGSGSWAPGSGSGAPGSGSGAPGSGSGSWAPESGAPSSGSGSGSWAPGAGAGSGAGAGKPTTLVAVHPTGGAAGAAHPTGGAAHPTGGAHPSGTPAGGHAGGSGTSGFAPIHTAGASRMSWTVAALVGAILAGVMAL